MTREKAKFVPREKMSKKNQRELNLNKRCAWSISPITRLVENKKLYNRRKIQDGDNFRNEPSYLFV